MIETNFKDRSHKVVPLEGIFPMLKLYATDAVRDRITLTYRDYDLELTRAPSGWRVASIHAGLTFPFFREVIFALAMKKARSLRPRNG